MSDARNLLVGLIVVATLGRWSLADEPVAPAGAPATQPAATTQPVEEDVEEVRLHGGRAGEYQQLFDAVTLTPEQTATVRQRLADRQATLQAWIDGNQGRELVRLRTELAAARREKRTAEVGPLRERIQPLADEYFKVREQTRLNILSALTPDQLSQYVSATLVGRVTRGLERVGLTEAQLATIRRMSDERVGEYLAKTPVERDVFFRGLDPIVEQMKPRIVSEVLTEEQRTALRAERSRPTTRSSEGAGE